MKFLKKENLNIVIDIVEKIIDFNKQQKGKGCPLDLTIRLKILTRKQILPIALAYVKAGSTYENLLNEISRIISLYCNRRNY